MRYKVLHGTETFDKLLALRERMKEACEAAKEIAESVGCKKWIAAMNIFVMSGGITAFQFDQKPEGWKKYPNKHYKNLYVPKEGPANADLLNKIKNLPLVEYDDFNKIVNYEEQDIPQEHTKPVWSTHPGFSFVNEQFLLTTVEGAVFNYGKDIVEITNKEYMQISASRAVADAINNL